MGIFDRLLGRKTTAQNFKGALAVRRLKTYQAESGYVYQYVYGGKREIGTDSKRIEEFVFDVSADRRTWFSTTIILRQSAVIPWEADTGRALTATERYAVAKMALMGRLDEAEAPGLLREPVMVTAESARELLRRLDL